ncbi:MAG: iron-containing alcohol dehydrogenase [Thermodesulfobacteriota bacterium]
MPDLKERAVAVLKEFKGEAYAFGGGVLDTAPGKFAAEFGKKALFVGPVDAQWFRPIRDRVLRSLEKAGVEVLESVQSAAPNAPFEDVYRILGRVVALKPDVLVVADGGSGIDAVKAAAVLATLGGGKPDIDPYFGVGQVTEACRKTGLKPMPVVAVMMAASSGAHLTKYSNITDLAKGQKKLIVDEAIVPPRAVFDYDVTTTQPMSLTLDGGLDGIAHCLEVYFGAASAVRDRARQVAELGIELVIEGLVAAKKDPASKEARTLLGLGTDLGGYAIMIGGTSGAHLSSFSLVDVLSHGRACALMNPYYTVFFAPAIQEQLRVVGRIYRKHGYMDKDPDSLSGRELGLAVAEAMIRFGKFLDFPTRLSDVKGIGREHIDRCLTAAKNPQLDMKLRNMPVPLNAGLIDQYMGPILEAAWSGDFGLIKNM